MADKDIKAALGSLTTEQQAAVTGLARRYEERLASQAEIIERLLKHVKFHCWDLTNCEHYQRVLAQLGS